MISGSFLVALGMGLLALPGKNANYFIQYLPGLILFGLGMALVIAPLTKSALAVQSKYSGAASGINNAVARVAGLFAVALLGIVVVVIFRTNLRQNLNVSGLNPLQKQQIIAQQNKLGGIQIPHGFNAKSKVIAQNAIDDSFIAGFRWAMGINALLALFSTLIAFLLIHNPVASKQKS